MRKSTYQLDTAVSMKMFDFIYELPRGYQDFPEHVMHLLSEHFGYHRMVFIPLNREYRFLLDDDPRFHFQEKRVFNVSSAMEEGYNLWGYKYDVFRFCVLPQSLWHKPVLFGNDVVPQGRFYNTEYGQLLLKVGTPYQAVLNLTVEDVCLGLIVIYRSSQEGPFTVYDCEILKQACRFITQHYLMVINNTPKNLLATLFARLSKSLDTGTILLDAKFEILDANSTAKHYAADILRSVPQSTNTALFLYDTPPVIQKLIHSFKRELFYSKQPLVVETASGSYELKRTEFTLPNPSLGTTEAMHLISISRNTSPSVQPSSMQIESDLLTKREREIVELISKGYTNSQIAQEAFISIHTVKAHILNIYKKLGVKNRAHLLYTLTHIGE